MWDELLHGLVPAKEEVRQRRMQHCDERVVAHEEIVGEIGGSGRQHGLGCYTTGIGQGMDEQYGWSESLAGLEAGQGPV